MKKIGILWMIFMGLFFVGCTKDKKGIWKEFCAFVGARIATGILEQVIMIVMVKQMGVHHMIAKFVCNVVVIISNYIFSKLFVFKKADEGKK